MAGLSERARDDADCCATDRSVGVPLPVRGQRYFPLGFAGVTKQSPSRAGMRPGKKGGSGAVRSAGHVECRSRSSCGPRPSVWTVRCARPYNRVRAPPGASLLQCAVNVCAGEIGGVSAARHQAARSMLSSAHPQRHLFLIDWQRAPPSSSPTWEMGALNPDELFGRELQCWSSHGRLGRTSLKSIRT